MVLIEGTKYTRAVYLRANSSGFALMFFEGYVLYAGLVFSWPWAKEGFAWDGPCLFTWDAETARKTFGVKAKLAEAKEAQIMANMESRG